MRPRFFDLKRCPARLGLSVCLGSGLTWKATACCAGGLLLFGAVFAGVFGSGGTGTVMSFISFIVAWFLVHSLLHGDCTVHGELCRRGADRGDVTGSDFTSGDFL